ncbi:class C sortase [Leucobacter viscericola]|uniref:Class C sortase n=1 Tax=Leucobacter viscericola TaxID=2714935 RepID=A0A6G7XDM9_9MICO|nr:class C sortase [Leucobacter viscericola]QIK62653.1 class C sortase [Leucobacter viscericola]
MPRKAAVAERARTPNSAPANKNATGRASKGARLHRLLICGIALIGVVVFLFPTIANWFSSLDYKEQREKYTELTQSLSSDERDRLLFAAHNYNKHLPSGPLRDPYMLDDAGQTVDLRDDNENYLSQLNLGKGKEMGWIEIPNIHVSLPIHHGTDAKTLELGAGHLHGSALPVGGTSTHAVVTAHSGRATSQLFTDLDKLKKGDVFYSEVLGERFYYRVDNIEVVDPLYSGDKLRQIAGEDHLTLLTCTPTGVNSHRLLVRGVRIDNPEGESAEKEVRAKDYVADFPWWIPVVIGVPTTAWFVLAAADKRGGRTRRNTTNKLAAR